MNTLYALCYQNRWGEDTEEILGVFSSEPKAEKYRDDMINENHGLYEKNEFNIHYITLNPKYVKY